MRNIIKFMTLSVVALAAGCDGGNGLVAPESCELLAPLSVLVGETETISPCFNDSSGEPISYSVTSSAPAIAEGRVSGDKIVITGYAPGNTTIAITATTSAGSGEATQTVIVPNRAPEVIDEYDKVLMGVGWTFDVPLLDLFREPDNQELMYSVSISVATRSTVVGDTLVIEAVQRGTSELIITATDGTADVSAIIPISVLDREVVYADGFTDPEETLSDSTGWFVQYRRPHKAHLVITDENELELWGDDPVIPGIGSRITKTSGFEFSTSVRSGLKDAAATVVVAAITEHKLFRELFIELLPYAPRPTYRIHAIRCDVECQQQRTLPESVMWAMGTYVAGSDDWIDVRAGYRHGQYHIWINDDDPIRVGDKDTTHGDMRVIGLWTSHYTGSVDNRPLPNQHVFMDTVTVTGFISAEGR